VFVKQCFIPALLKSMKMSVLASADHLDAEGDHIEYTQPACQTTMQKDVVSTHPNHALPHQSMFVGTVVITIKQVCASANVLVPLFSLRMGVCVYVCVRLCVCGSFVR